MFSFGDFFENIGGFYSGIIAIGMILVPFFSERLFYSSLIKNIYQIEGEKVKQEEDD